MQVFALKFETTTTKGETVRMMARLYTTSLAAHQSAAIRNANAVAAKDTEYFYYVDEYNVTGEVDSVLRDDAVIAEGDREMFQE